MHVADEISATLVSILALRKRLTRVRMCLNLSRGNLSLVGLRLADELAKNELAHLGLTSLWFCSTLHRTNHVNR